MAKPKIEVGLRVDTKQGTKDLKDFTKKAKTASKGISDAVNNSKIGSMFEKATGSVTGFTSSLKLSATVAGAAAGAITLLGGSVLLLTKSLVNEADEINRLSLNTGIATKSISSLFTAVSEGGGGIDDLSDMINDMTEKLGDARLGNNGFADSFKKLGVDISGSPEKALQTSISTLASMEDKTKALFLGIEIFGDKYKTISDEVAKGNNIMKKSPLFNDSFIKSSVILKKNISLMATEIKTTTTKALTPFLETLSKISGEMLDSEGFDNFLEGINTIGIALNNFANWTRDLTLGFSIIGLEEDIAKIHTLEKKSKELADNVIKHEKKAQEAKFEWQVSWNQTIADQQQGLLEKYTSDIVKLKEKVAKNYSKIYNPTIKETTTKTTTKTKDLTELTAGVSSAVLAGFKSAIAELKGKNYTEDIIESLMNKDVILRHTDTFIDGFNIPWIKTSPFDKWGTSFDKFIANYRLTSFTTFKDIKDALLKSKAEIEASQGIVTKPGEDPSFDNRIPQEKSLKNTLRRISEAKALIKKQTLQLEDSSIIPMHREAIEKSNGYLRDYLKIHESWLIDYKKYNAKVRKELADSPIGVRDSPNYDTIMLSLRNLSFEEIRVAEAAEDSAGVFKEAWKDTFRSFSNDYLTNISVVLKEHHLADDILTEEEISEIKIKLRTVIGTLAQGLGKIGSDQFGIMKEEIDKIVDDIQTVSKTIAPEEFTSLPLVDILFGPAGSIEERAISIINGVTSAYANIADQASQFASTMADRKQMERQHEIDSENRHYNSQMKNFRGSNRQKEILEKEHLKVTLALEEKMFNEKKKSDKKKLWANSFMNQGIAFANGVSQFGFPAGPIIGGVMATAILANTIASSVNIDKQQFEKGGVLGGFMGATDGKDTQTYEGRPGEMIFNARQQRNLFDMVNAGGQGNSKQQQSINYNVNFEGNVTNDQLTELEDMLITLNSNGRISDRVFS